MPNAPQVQGSILVRTLIRNLLLVAGACVVTGAIFLITLRSVVNRQLARRASDVAMYLANRAQFPMLVGDRSELEELAQGAMASRDGLFVVITDRQGVTVSHALPGFPAALIPATADAPLAPTDGSAEGFATVVWHDARAGAPSYMEARQAVAGPDSSGLLGIETRAGWPSSIGAVAVGISLEQESAATASATHRAFLAAALWLGLMLIFQFRQLRAILEPIRSLARFTASIGEGSLDRRIKVTGSGEVAEVALAFNGMLDRLAATLVSKAIAEEANLTKSRFLANTGHELRTPLNAIIGYSELLEEECADQNVLLPDLRKIRNSAHILRDLMNDLLDYSRMEQGRTQLDLEIVSVAAVMTEVGSTVEGLAHQNGNRFAVELPAEDLAVYCDRGKFRQSLLNLAANACKFTENGAISMSASAALREGKEWGEIRVRDSGIGIAADNHGKLFQPFVQVDASQTRKHGGTGLGLAISRKLCRLMGGDITFESELNRGSIFTIALPSASGDTEFPNAAEEQSETVRLEENSK